MSSAQQLNKLITRTNEWKAIVRVCESEVHRFTIINCSTAISRLAKARDFHECDMKTVEKVIKRIRVVVTVGEIGNRGEADVHDCVGLSENESGRVLGTRDGVCVGVDL